MKYIITTVVIVLLGLGGWYYYKSNKTSIMKNQSDDTLQQNSGWQVKPGINESDHTLTASEKNLVIQALLKRKDIIASKDVNRIRNLYLKTFSTQGQVNEMTDSEILDSADRDLGYMEFLDVNILSHPSVEYFKDGDVVEVEITEPPSGRNRLFSIVLIDGVWY